MRHSYTQRCPYIWVGYAMCMMAAIIMCGVTAVAKSGDTASAEKTSLGVPPLVKGGIAGFAPAHHRYLTEHLGTYHPLNHDNSPYATVHHNDKNSGELVEMGRFDPSGELLFATLVRVKERSDGILLVIFSWSDTTEPVRYYNFIDARQVLLSTVQGIGSNVDTLRYSCSRNGDWCGQVYYSQTQHSFVIRPNPAYKKNATHQ